MYFHHQGGLNMLEAINKNIPHEEDGSYLQQVKEVVKELVNHLVTMVDRTKYLPEIDEDGNSKCHFAEDMYAEQEESIQDVQQDIEELRGMKPKVKELIDKGKNNLQTLRKDHKSINNDRAASKYTFAEIHQKYQHEGAMATLKQVDNVLSWAENALAMAKAKKYPGKTPEKQLHIQKHIIGEMQAPQVSDNGNQKTDSAVLVPPPLKTPIEGLINLGPMNGQVP